MAVVAKKKPTIKKISETKLREPAEQALAEFQESSELRTKGALAVYEAQATIRPRTRSTG